jgi:hypothetical protein
MEMIEYRTRPKRLRSVVPLPIGEAQWHLTYWPEIKKERTNNKMVMYVSKIPGDGHASFHRDSQSEKN